VCPADVSFVCSNISPPIPLTSEDTASPERGGEDRREQELGEELELCQTVKGRKERREQSHMPDAHWDPGLKRTSGH